MNPTETVISAQGLTKVFKDFWGRPKARAVSGIDFEVKRGEVFGLLGPNGSGKSTTVKMLLGLLYPSKGRISVFGHSPRHVQTKARLGYLPEESYLYRYLNSEETVDFFGSLFHIESKERRERAEQLIQMVGLENARRRHVGEFSKGMQRRIGLAQALINDPDLVILDEPTSGLDPIGCREIKDLILTLAERGKTVILSSHLLSDVEDVCDRAMILYGGKVQAIGTMKELLSNRNATRITSPALSRETMDKVLTLIREDTQSQEVHVDNPTENLESLFLNIVEQARQRESETSGATSGHQVADYLRGDTSQNKTDRALDHLTRNEEPTIKQTSKPQRKSETVGEDKLADLSRTETDPAPPSTVTPKKEEDLDKANDKLSGLLGD
ncbi:MAG: ABC transporter ATP-binding protein [Verrucomicrobiota bacterium]|jgi:ABC-2 type transport system ATP-binding protein|nr:ABC transporter ATP-binding protein [Verrucomicrobiota bacterium]MEE2614457.1 ABC transporter ATP-binding protein [Verrucomicrobiota bacterium]